MKKGIFCFVLFTVCVCLHAQNSNPLALTTGLNSFAVQSYAKISEGSNTNLIYSPYSVSSLLTILSQGAAGKTRQQFNAVLSLPTDPNKNLRDLAQINHSLSVAPVCSGRFSCLIKKMSAVFGNRAVDKTLLANGIWLDKSISINPTFLDKMNAFKYAEFYHINFRTEPDSARHKINDWVSEETNGLIKDLLSPGTITSMTKMVLANAIYFKACWDIPFDSKQTKPMPFVTLNNGKQTVPMMYQKHAFPYFENESVQLTILPYSKSQLAMAILLPKPLHTLNQLLPLVAGQNFEKIISQAYIKDLRLFLPKFHFSSSLELSKPLKSLGLEDAFSDAADFSLLTNTKLNISAVIQKAMIDMDEKGTTAAAATGVVMATLATPTKPIIFMADHPFIFIIFERDTHAIIFMGQIANPALPE